MVNVSIIFHLFICQLFIYVTVDLWIFIPINIFQYYDTYFVAQIVHALAMEKSFSWLLCPFDISPMSCVLSIALLHSTIRCSVLILYISCLSLRTSHFSKPQFLFFENGIRNQDLSGSLFFPLLLVCHFFLGCFSI